MKALEHAAKSIGDQLYQKLSDLPGRGEIHSVYQNVINIQLNGTLLTLGKAKIGNGPYTILIPNTVENLDEWGVQPGTPVMIDCETLRLGPVRVNLKEAIFWSSDWQEVPRLEHLRNLLPQLQGLVTREGNLRGLGMLLLSAEQRNEAEIIEYTRQVLIEQAEPLIVELNKSMYSEPRQFWSSLLDFVGLGPGLTPAGDDFIIGYILTLRYLEWGGIIRLPELSFPAVREQVKRDTNLISATGVLLALEGKPIELVRDVLESICTGSKVNTILSALRLMDRGSTSGTDIITGIIIAGGLFTRTHRLHWRYYN